MSKPSKFKVDDYGDVFAVVNDLKKVSYEDDGGYQGEYKVVLTDGKRLFYYFDYYGSCSGCDWLEDVRDWDTGEVSYKEAVDYCAGIKPKYIVPKNRPLEFSAEEYDGWKLKPTKPANLKRKGKLNG